MIKPYGYKQQDIIELAEYLKDKENRPLKTVFEEFAKKQHKSKGTVRNIYYALAKLSRKDEEFCAAHLGGKEIKVTSAKSFDDGEGRAICKKILTEKMKGKSVRQAIYGIADGDEKLALRYQNKFRNMLKKERETVFAVVEELRAENGELDENVFSYCNYRGLSGENNGRLAELRKEIDALVDRIAEKTKSENALLKKRIVFLEAENRKLSAMLFRNYENHDSLQKKTLLSVRDLGNEDETVN